MMLNTVSQMQGNVIITLIIFLKILIIHNL